MTNYRLNNIMTFPQLTFLTEEETYKRYNEYFFCRRKFHNDAQILAFCNKSTTIVIKVF